MQREKKSENKQKNKQKTLCCTPGINIVLYVNYTSIRHTHTDTQTHKQNRIFKNCRKVSKDVTERKLECQKEKKEIE